MRNSLTSRDFDKILSSAKSLVTRDLSFKYLHASLPRIGFIVSRRYGRAVHRNLFKRRCRQQFQMALSRGLDITVIVRPRRSRIPMPQIEQSFDRLIQKII